MDVIKADEFAPLTHGFFTRRGGVSTGVYSGLNCGLGSNDAREDVLQNRALVAQHMGVGGDHLRTVHQHHSDIVVTVENAQDALPKADGMVTKQRGIALGVLSADCQPVLFHDGAAGVIGAAHAGSKGSKGGVLQNTLEAMEGLGATRKNITAIIGPCISQQAYEVGPDFFDDITHDDPDAMQFFAGGQGDRMQFNLPLYGLHILRAAGVGQARWTGHCTYGDADRFFSYRRGVHQGADDYGRLIAAIVL